MVFASPPGSPVVEVPRKEEVRDRGWEGVVAGLKDLEYESFTLGNSQARNLIRRAVVMAVQGTRDRPQPPPVLLEGLRAALFLLGELRTEEHAALRVLAGFQSAQWFRGTTARLRRGWAMPGAGWEDQDRVAAAEDAEAAVALLVKHGPLPAEVRGTSELWDLLEALYRGEPTAPSRLCARMQRRFCQFDLADFAPAGEAVVGPRCEVTPGSYRGTAVVVKTVRAALLGPETIEACMVRARAWVDVFHPNVVPVLCCSTTVTTDQSVEQCATVVTRFTPGNTLSGVLSAAPALQPRDAMVLARDVARALVFSRCCPDSRECFSFREVEPGNVILCPFTGQARLLFPMLVHGVDGGLWAAPREVECSEAYCVGLLLWTCLTADKPMASGWRPPLLPSRSAANGIVNKACQGKGYPDVLQLLEDLDHALPSAPRSRLRDLARLATGGDSPSHSAANTPLPPSPPIASLLATHDPDTPAPPPPLC
eukprot:Hpha_TRINITY_DN18705_c0_g1::TRINITY_DN18705_c0_g1_i1::g.47385::m.47385